MSNGSSHRQPELVTGFPVKHEPFSILYRLQVPAWVFDIDRGCIARANDAACRLWQADGEADLCARDMRQDMTSSVETRLRQYQTDFEDHDARFTELWTLYPKSQPTSVMVVFSGYRMTDGRMAMLCEVVGSVDDSPENLRSAEALLHTDVMITLYDRAGPPLYMNPAARKSAAAPMQHFHELFRSTPDYVSFRLQLESEGEERSVVQVITSNGPRWFDISAKHCLDAATGRPAILVTSIDVSELKNARDTARYLADRDQLTGCYNRSYLQAWLSHLAERKPDCPCAIIYFDVDRFKQINDMLGHEMGDRVLQRISGRTRMILDDDVLIARLGGDEFVVLAENVASDAALDAIVERLRQEIARPGREDGSRVDATISIGVARFLPGSVDFTHVMREADLALYAAKQAGRNTVVHFTDEMGRAARERDRMESDLRGALAERQFQLHYQPRMSLATGTVVSVEGLVRWQHPDRGMVPPDAFIPICEETGLIEDLGQLVLDMGCEQSRMWNAQGSDLAVSINISPRQFKDESLIFALRNFAERPGFVPGKIELEITENVLIGDHAKIAEKLHTITDMGYRIAIDDFGTGYSNLSYISRFPLTCLKIDRSFIAQLPETGPIIRLILTMAQEIGAITVAEGVETQEQLDWLRQHNCDQVQGYLLSPAVPFPQLKPVIKRIETTAAQATAPVDS